MAKSTLKHIKKSLQVKAPLTPDPSVSPENTDLFKIAYKDVVPLPPSDIYQHQSHLPSPHPRHSSLSSLAQLERNYVTTEPNFIPHREGFYRPGQRRDMLKRMRRKDWIIQSTLDLHGMTACEAQAATQHFLNQCLQQGLQRLCIIHGKGLSSSGQKPILKKYILQWLICQSVVLALTHPPAAQGGTGALLVLIKKQATGE